VPFCARCGTEIAEGATCPKCAAGSAPVATGAGLEDNVAGALAYVTIIPAIVFLVLEPYNRKRFIRFHAFQSILFFVAWVVVGIALSILPYIPLLWTTVRVVFFVVLVIAALKAYQGQMFKLPVIGDMAEKQSGSFA
jgi:uncharacterized membrane protein